MNFACALACVSLAPYARAPYTNSDWSEVRKHAYYCSNRESAVFEWETWSKSLATPNNIHDHVNLLSFVTWSLSSSQGRSHQIWGGQVRGGQVRSAYIGTLRLGGSGGWSSGKFWNLEIMTLHLRPFLGKYDASRRPDDMAEFHMYEYLLFLPIASYSNSSAFRLSRKPHPSKMRLVGDWSFA